MNETQEKLNNEAQRAVWLAKSISAENRLPVLHPEAFAIAIVGYPPNIVTRILAQLHADAGKIVGRLRDVLSVRKQEDGPVFQTRVSMSGEMVQAMRVAMDARNRTGSTMVGVHHVMLALIKLNEFVRDAMEREGVTLVAFDAAVKNLMSVRPKDKPIAPSPDDSDSARAGVGIKGQRTAIGQPGVKKSRNVLDNFCVDLTGKAQAAELDAVVGRQKEIDRLIVTLCRKKKNNPLLVGEHGVGKTALVEGLAQRIVNDTVPDFLRNKRIFALDLASMVAGTTYRGQFEERIKAVLNAIKENTDTIIFIDEIHTMIGAGGAVGALDASNMLKPALARGELRCIGATTEMEYKRYFKKDGALDRRFQRIRVCEPNVIETIEMLKGLRAGFEDHHHCSIPDDALEAAVRYSGRYIAERHYPDKAIDVIDEACAHFAHMGTDKVVITTSHIAQIISDQSGVPISVIMPSDFERLEDINRIMHTVVVGQDRAVDSLMSAVRNSYAGIRNPERPMGCFLFAGPSGVGKTYTAKEFAKSLFASDSSFIQINMTEFNDKFQSSRLLGSPPGYIGHGDRNQLADKVLQNPYCFVLFDEIDKADPEVMKILLPIMSEGRLMDAEGTEINFRNAFIGMTTNIGFGEYDKSTSIGFSEGKAAEQADKDKVLLKCRERFSPEFVNRIDEVILFKNFQDEDLERLVELELQKLALQSIDIGLTIEPDKTFCSQFVQMSKKHHGINGFQIQRAIQMDIRPEITAMLLKNRDKATKNIKLKIKGGKVVVV